MPKTVGELVELLDLETIEANLFRGQHPVTEMQRAFGGQVLAQALTAATHTVPPDREPHSLNAYFLHGGRTDIPIIYDVEGTRDGRSFSARRVVARQGGRMIFSLSASFQVAEDGLDHMDAMPPAPPPERCPQLSEIFAERSGRAQEKWELEWGVLDVRFAGDSRESGSIDHHAHSAHTRMWVKTTDSLPDLPAIDRAVLAYASDLTLLAVSTVPHRVRFGTEEVQAASIDHAMWFHRPVKADQWWLYDMISPSASGGRGFSLGRIYQDGQLIATCAQEGLIRVDPALAARRG